MTQTDKTKAPTQTDEIKTYLEKNGLGTSCNEALKKYEAEMGKKVAYSAFRRVYIMFTDGVNIKQTERQTAIGYETEIRQSKSGISYLVWKSIPENERITTNTSCVGARVLVADWGENSAEYEILKTHRKGEPQWPDSDGVTLLEISTDNKRYMEVQSVRLKVPSKKIAK